MGYKIQFRRGDKADLPQLDNGEPGFTEDTNELFIGTKEGNKNILSGATGTFVSSDGKTVTVKNGLIISIV